MDKLWLQFTAGLMSGFGFTFGAFAYKLGISGGLFIMFIAVAMTAAAMVMRHQWRNDR